MRFTCDDGGYLEIQRSKKPHHVHVLVAVRKADNPLELVVNSAEVLLSQIIEGVQSVSGPLMLETKEKENEEDSSESNSDNSTQKPKEQHTKGRSTPVDRRR